MTTKKTGHPAKSTPHHDIIIDAAHYAIGRQHGRIDSGLVALVALGFVAGWLLLTGGAR